jgi:heterodisulfide reductase subunit A
MKPRIGVFVCHCGLNIAATVEVSEVVKAIKDYPGVAHAQDYIYMCSDPGQELVRKAIREKNLTGLVMSNCSPSLHERTFRNLAASEGLNPYLVEVANIREYCSWPHQGDKETATKKALTIIKATIERVKRNQALVPLIVPLQKRVLVLGGGVAGMQTALDIAEGGYPVTILEKEAYLGGRVRQLDRTFISLESAPDLANEMIDRTLKQSNIEVLTTAQIEALSGYVGNFDVRVRQQVPWVDPDRCNNCEACVTACPVEVPSVFDRGLVMRKAIDWTPGKRHGEKNIFLDHQACLRVTKQENCTACQEVCKDGAISYPEDRFIDKTFGAIVVATGHDLYRKSALTEYAEDPDVLDALQFERLLSEDGPTNGKVLRPSDGKEPKEVVFVQCAGSRDPDKHFPYCSKVCCMYTCKEARRYKEKVPDGQAYIFFIDVRSTGKGYEEFVKESVQKERLLYLKGKVSKIARRGDKLLVLGGDTITGLQVEVEADLVVLAMATVPSPGAKDLARLLNINTDPYGFIQEAHPKLAPVETLTAGIYLAGTSQAPKDIPHAIYQAGGAASKILSLFSRKELVHEPLVAHVDTEVCAGCGYCRDNCAFQAVEVDPIRKKAVVNEALCEGCGACATACPSGAIQVKNLDSRQVFDMISVVTQDYALQP